LGKIFTLILSNLKPCENWMCYMKNGLAKKFSHFQKFEWSMPIILGQLLPLNSRLWLPGSGLIYSAAPPSSRHVAQQLFLSQGALGHSTWRQLLLPVAFPRKLTNPTSAPHSQFTFTSSIQLQFAVRNSHFAVFCFLESQARAAN